MANFAGTFTSPYNSPTFNYDISYVQTGRGSGWASYSVTVTARMSTSYDWFGYPLYATVTIGNVSQAITLKNTETWSGTGGHTFTFNLTPTGVGDGGGTISARLQVTSSGGVTSGLIDTGGDETVTASVWNTAPTMSGTVTTSPSGTIAENLTSITTTWTAGTDPEGGALTYELSRELNKSGTWTVLSTNATSGYADASIGSGNQGQVIRYRVRAKDNGGLYSGYIYSSYVTKNTFTSPTFTMGSSIAFASTSVALTIGTPTNTNGSTSFTYVLSCSQITVYNATQTTKPTSILIWRTGDATPASTQPYIKFADIKTATSAYGYIRTFNFTLTTRNAYGSSGTASASTSVNITVAPINGLGTIATSGTYTLTVASVNYYYYVPNRKAITVTWGACTDQLGGSITYDVYVSYDAGSTFSILASDLTTTSYTANLPAVTSMKQCKFKVYAYTSYGTSVNAVMPSAIQLHYYNPPTIVYDDVVRNQTTATVSGTVKPNTSIPLTQILTNTTTPSTFYTTSGGLVTASTATTYASADRSFTKTFNIAENVSCTFNITIQENMGTVCGTANATLSVYVPVYVPMLAIRSLGVAVNAQPATDFMFTVGGDVKLASQTSPKILLQPTTDVAGIGGRIDFKNMTGDQGVRIRHNHYDSELIPFGLHIEVDDENTTGLKPYLKVDGQIYGMGQINAYGGIKATTSMATQPQLVGDYSENSTANKMIWTIGDSWKTWATHYGLGYEYITVSDVVNQHALTFRSAGVTKAKISLSNGGAEFSGEVQGLSMSAGTIGVENTDATTGYGVSLYGGQQTGQPTYGLFFGGTATFGTHGNVSADWATYFTMNSTANRGWIFRNMSTPINVASISNAGTMYLNGSLNSTTAGTGTFGTALRASYNCAYISHSGYYIEVRSDGTINYSSGTVREYITRGADCTRFAHSGTYLEYKTGAGVAYGLNNFTSDRRLKTNIGDTLETNSLDKILAIKHREFEWIADGRKVHLGYIAQELEEIDNEFVQQIPQSEDSEFDVLYKVNETSMIPHITKAIQELKQIIDNQAKEIADLKMLVNNPA